MSRMVSEEELCIDNTLWPMLRKIILEDGGTLENSARRAFRLGITLGFLYGETDATQEPQQRYNQTWEKILARIVPDQKKGPKP